MIPVASPLTLIVVGILLVALLASAVAHVIGWVLIVVGVIGLFAWSGPAWGRRGPPA